MASIKNHTSVDVTKLLLVGDSGSGKTAILFYPMTIRDSASVKVSAVVIVRWSRPRAFMMR